MSKRKNFVLNSLFNFEPVKRFKNMMIFRSFGEQPNLVQVEDD